MVTGYVAVFIVDSQNFLKSDKAWWFHKSTFLQCCQTIGFPNDVMTADQKKCEII